MNCSISFWSTNIRYESRSDTSRFIVEDISVDSSLRSRILRDVPSTATLYVDADVDLDVCCTRLTSVLPLLSALTTVNLQVCVLDLRVWKCISDWIATHCRLRILSWWWLPSKRQLIEMMCESIARSTLRELEISAHDFLANDFRWKDAFIPVVRKIATTKTLKSVKMRNCLAIASANADEFVDALLSNYTIVQFGFPTFLIFSDRFEDFLIRNQSLRWGIVAQTIVLFAVALFEACEFPLYAVLAVVDAVPYYGEAHAQYKKVRVLERVFASLRKIKNR